MRKTDVQLITELKAIFDRYIEDQSKPQPHHKIQSLPSEIHGSLSDLLFIDKVDNDALVNFITGLLYTHENRSDVEIISLVKDIQQVLSGYNFDADDTGKANE